MQSKEKICKLIDDKDFENKILGLQILLKSLNKSNALYWYFKLAVWFDEDLNEKVDNETFNKLNQDISKKIKELTGNQLLVHNDNLNLFKYVNSNFDTIDIDSLTAYFKNQISVIFRAVSNKSNINYKDLLILKSTIIKSLSDEQSNKSNKDL